MRFTLEELKAEVTRLANEYPEAVYVAPPNDEDGECYYGKGRTHQGPPDGVGCIMGQAIRNLDPDFPFQEKVGVGAMLLDFQGSDVRTDEHTWLDRVQTRQDTGTPWLRALTGE